MTAWSQHSIKVGLQSVSLTAAGGKILKFKDGQVIKYNSPGDYLFNMLMGNMGH